MNCEFLPGAKFKDSARGSTLLTDGVSVLNRSRAEVRHQVIIRARKRAGDRAKEGVGPRTEQVR